MLERKNKNGHFWNTKLFNEVKSGQIRTENTLEDKALFENGAVPKWLRERSAKPRFAGSSPARALKY